MSADEAVEVAERINEKLVLTLEEEEWEKSGRAISKALVLKLISDKKYTYNGVVAFLRKVNPGISYGENQLRWGFVRKVYGILAAQIVLTTIVSSFTVLYAPLNDLLRGNSALLLILVFLPFLLLWPLYVYQQKHPVNLVILALFTTCLSLTVGVSCANTDGTIVLQALFLTSVVVSSLTAYTFWASKKGKDFNYLGPFLFSCLMVLVMTGMVQMFFPIGPTLNVIYGGVGAMVFSGYIVYDTDNLIKRHTYDEYIWASVTLYLDILNLFLTILRMMRQSDG